MTVNILFKVNPETKNLIVSIDSKNFDSQMDSLAELDYAKKILATAVQLNFVTLPVSTGIDVGGKITISRQGDEDYDRWYDEEYDESHYNESNHNDFGPDEDGIKDPEENDIEIKERAQRKEAREKNVIMEEEVDDVFIEVPFVEGSLKGVQDFVSGLDPELNLSKESDESNWAFNDDNFEIRIDLTDSSEIIGGLTTPSAIATIMIYSLFKRIIYNVEKSTNRVD